MTVQVHHLERAEGCLLPLHQLLADWARSGRHDVLVAPNGGLRTDAVKQSTLASLGLSRAKELRHTPHGRGAAVDVWPASFLAHVPVAEGGTARRWTSWDNLPVGVQADFMAFGEFAESHGFTWGGRWRSASFPHGDQPHVEMRGWTALPFPPTRVTY